MCLILIAGDAVRSSGGNGHAWTVVNLIQGPLVIEWTLVVGYFIDCWFRFIPAVGHQKTNFVGGIFWILHYSIERSNNSRINWPIFIPGKWNFPNEKSSHKTTPKDQTSDWLEKTISVNDSGAIHLTGSYSFKIFNFNGFGFSTTSWLSINQPLSIAKLS